ncbi:site-specific integrase [Candidatus Hecatella orcuttiae]|uniref:site-specific integrase n=1 Tax=Candidatus Hecatella orcuttiae TaxID=1935119 RepID=UPI002867BC2D|nr:site-specific integrase [Candidatus Hecatella orcuttiae]
MSRVRDSKGRFLRQEHSYSALMGYPQVRNWIDNYRSKETREAYMRCLETVVKETGLSPGRLVKLPVDRARHAVMGVVRKLVQDGKLTMAKQIQIALKGFFEANDKELKFKRAEQVKRVSKKVHAQITPTQEEIYRMVDALPEKRNKAIILCLFQSGVRVGCLCRWTYGLVKDQLYPEIKVPTVLKITNEIDTKLSGYGLPYYYTFLQAEAAQALRDYLDERKAKEGELKPEDPVFAPLTSKATKEGIDEVRVLEVVKRAAKSIGLDPRGVWTHTLRKSFRKVLYAANIEDDMAEALMGHKLRGSKESYFDKKDLREIAANYMRANFSRATVQVTEEAWKEIRRQQLRRDMKELYGVDLEELLRPKIAKMKRPLTIDEELETLESKVRELWGMKLAKKQEPNGSGLEHRIVREVELVDLLNQGWEMVKELRDGRILVRKSA